VVEYISLTTIQTCCHWVGKGVLIAVSMVALWGMTYHC